MAKLYENICGRTIMVNARQVVPGQIIELDQDVGQAALIANGYLRDVTPKKGQQNLGGA